MSRLRLAWVVVLLALAGCTQAVSGTGTAAPVEAPGGPSTTPAPTPTGGAEPSGTCTNATLPTSGERGEALGLRLPTSTLRNLPVRADRSGPRTLDQLLTGLDEPARSELRWELEAARFTDAYERTWAGGTGPDRKVEVLVVYRFDSPAGACRFFADALRRGDHGAREVDGVPAAIGSDRTTGTIRTSVVLATKGRYVLEANALSYAEPPTSWPGELLASAYPEL